MSASKEVMQGGISKLCLVVAALALGTAAGSGECERGVSWWDRHRGVCVPCTRCDASQRFVVRYPCEIHRDTICQSLYEAQIPPFNTPPPPSEASEYDAYEYVDYDSEVTPSDDGVTWDLQTTSLSLAASGCIVFFVVVLVMSLYHARQWKVIKRALRSDVQDLTAKLKLMEAGGETTAEPVVAADHHIYCNIHVGKKALLGPNSTKGLGNVYTQEKHNP
ncbi:tumor necrosis factor receptor superfamily member wengen [Anticarsia gemmatalis]|uniref:tumor necrosis factor receptor superfamily member wengen n=1 Tax=Anticarsia gemmatalis TaxID=129554 RepID=UPI003F775D23